MKCPNCNETLIMSDRQGIEIDYCPGCRGVWLDRGELDKIIERSAAYMKNPDEEQYRNNPYNNKDSGQYNQQHYKRKKKGFLGDFFDFD